MAEASAWARARDEQQNFEAAREAAKDDVEYIRGRQEKRRREQASTAGQQAGSTLCTESQEAASWKLARGPKGFEHETASWAVVGDLAGARVGSLACW